MGEGAPKAYDRTGRNVECCGDFSNLPLVFVYGWYERIIDTDLIMSNELGGRNLYGCDVNADWVLLLSSMKRYDYL